MQTVAPQLHNIVMGGGNGVINMEGENILSVLFIQPVLVGEDFELVQEFLYEVICAFKFDLLHTFNKLEGVLKSFNDRKPYIKQMIRKDSVKIYNYQHP